MLRVHWTADFSEAYVVEAMLRAHDIPATVFDGGMVHLDWFKTLVFGGYRVMVPDNDAARARELTTAFRTSALSLLDDEADEPACPHCETGRGVEDPQPCTTCAATGRAAPRRAFIDLSRDVEAHVDIR